MHATKDRPSGQNLHQIRPNVLILTILYFNVTTSMTVLARSSTMLPHRGYC